MFFRAAQDHKKAAGRLSDFVNALFNTMGGSGGNDTGT
jgi:hypothetical protein